MAKRALVVEGGGMKAAYANGVLSAFEDAEHAPWDAVIGTSAGGALGAWYSAGQAAYAEHTWAYARDPRILSYRRMALGRPVLDHEALLDIVYVDEHPIDQDAVRRAPWPVVVTGADIDTGACVYHDLRDGDIIPWLKATGRLPLGCGPPVTIDGRRYIDGGSIDPIPLRYVVERMGCTDVTLVLNTPPGPRRPDPRFMAEVAARRFPKLRDGITRHQEIKQSCIDYALDPPKGVHVDVIRPAAKMGVHRLSRDMAAINGAIEQGRRDGMTYLATQLALP